MQWPLFQIHQSAALCRSLMSPGVWLQISLLPNNADQIFLLEGVQMRAHPPVSALSHYDLNPDLLKHPVNWIHSNG